MTSIMLNLNWGSLLGNLIVIGVIIFIVLVILGLLYKLLFEGRG